MDNLNSKNNFQSSIVLDATINDSNNNIFLSKINTDNSNKMSIKKAALSDISCNSFLDGLTGLPNHNSLLEHIDNAISIAQGQSDFVFAVLFLDIDRFRTINNSFGRNIGDRLLGVIGKELATCLRSQDLSLVSEVMNLQFY